MLTLLLCSAAVHALPSFEAVRAAHRPSDLTLLDRHGTPLQTLRVDPSVRRLPWVSLADMSPALLQAIVLSEDRRFWEHGGVDWSAVASSAFGNLWNTRTRGASTLTMQLAGLLDDDLARPPQGRSVAQKLGQAVAAQRLEARWRKSQILEAYLNTVPLRGELVGIGAVSQTLFGKHPSGLDAFEAAITAALLRAPNAGADAVARRACGVLQDMKLECTGVATLTANALVRRGGMPLGEQIAPHAARQFLRRDGPAAQRSTLDAGVQRVAIGALRAQLAELRSQQVDDGAVIVLDNATGEVLAWVGSAGATSEAAQVDHVLARRQPGSTLKPFLYGLAFERRLLTPASLVDDSPAQIATTAGLYVPQNYDRRFQGWVSARTALGASLNVPAVRVATLLPPDALFERLNALGLALPESGGYYGHALALGGADVTLLSLANAYRALANGGVYSAPALALGGVAGVPTRPVGGAAGESALPAGGGGGSNGKSTLLASGAAGKPAVPGTPRTPRRVMDAASSFLVGHILADNSARAITFGLDSAMATRGWAAVKTGTSKDLRDNWCLGFTDRYTVGVWVGNASGAPMHAVSGIAGAAPVWRELVQHLHRERVSRPPAVPAGVQAMRVHLDAAAEPPREEWFIAGTMPVDADATLTAARAAQRLGIHSPADGSVFALDPDIPPQSQRITFEGAGGSWWLDGRRLGTGQILRWPPWPGRHTLALVGPDGRTLQTVRFEVRGAIVKPRTATGSAPARRTPRARRPRTAPRKHVTMRRPVRVLTLRRLGWALPVVWALALGGCASVPPRNLPDAEPDAAGAIVAAPIELEGHLYAARWYLPAGEASALIVLQHGFTRRCSHLHETTRQIMAAGLMALCVDAPMAGGNPGLAEALARHLADAPAAPDGRALPAPMIVGGHSAGAAFAVRLGAQLDLLAPQRLAGALLFDPVATAGFAAALQRISDAGRRPVLALLANAHGCNAQLNAAPALHRVRQDALEAGRQGFVGVQLTEGSSHADVEGEDTDWIAVAACGPPLPANVAMLRRLAVQWAPEIARAVPPTPVAGPGWRLIE